MLNFRLLDTAGIEIEIDNIELSKLPANLSNDFSLTHDASVETNDVHTFNGTPISPSRNLKKFFYKTTLGKEIVSRKPLEIDNDDTFLMLDMLFKFLKERGVNSKSTRSGIHIHITCGPNFNIIKEIFKIGLYLEASLYYFGGMGYSFRGQKNNSAYCFPLSRPPIVQSIYGNGKRRYVPLYVIDDILSYSGSYSGLLERIGDIEVSNGNRFVPARYSFIDYYSLFLRGSLEFRVFNLSLCPYSVLLAIKLCRHITKDIIRRSMDSIENELPINSIVRTSKENAMKVMEDYLVSTGFPQVYGILNIMEKTPEILISNDKIFTHLMFHPNRGNICPNLFVNTKYCPDAEDTINIREPITQQSHNIQYEYEPFPKIRQLFSDDDNLEKDDEFINIFFPDGKRKKTLIDSLNYPIRTHSLNLDGLRERLIVQAPPNISPDIEITGSFIEDDSIEQDNTEQEETF